MTFARRTYDLIVVGGGPAGCAAAISAKRACPSASILLLEKSSYPRHKVCGEFISPEALGLLRSLVGDNGLSGGSLHLTRAELLVGRTRLEVSLKPPAISLARYQLDALLWSAAQRAGAECVNATVIQVTPMQDGFQVSVGNDALQGRAVINATGRWSNLSSAAPNTQEKWIGLKAHFAERSPEPSVSLYFFAGGYCGVQPVGADSINACAMVRADVAKDLSAVLKQHPALSSRSRSWTQRTETFATSPLLFRPPRATQDRMLLVGDAAGFIDPFLGDGISLALRSGSMAGEAVAHFCRGKLTWDCLLANYETAYRDNLGPAFTRASRLRRLLSLPAIVRTPLLRLARLPGLAELVFRKTRPAAA
jgi:menaquinone-9 beta-reductase